MLMSLPRATSDPETTPPLVVAEAQTKLARRRLTDLG